MWTLVLTRGAGRQSGASPGRSRSGRIQPMIVFEIDAGLCARAVTEAIGTMVTRMGLRTIAEGVERPEQHDLLATLGVREAQGFLYLRPQPAAQFVDWLSEHLPVTEAAGVLTVIPFAPRH